METPTIAALQRTFRFVCGSASGRTVLSDDLQTVAEPKTKRQRVDEHAVVEVRLVEFIRNLDEVNEDHDKHYGLFVWPSALLLSRFIAHDTEKLCRDKVVLELGCGTGLPSILAGLCGAAKIYLTDRADAVDIQRNAEANIKLNGLEGRAAFIPLMWGDVHMSDEIISIFRTVDIVFAADCFYQSEDFEKVIATVALVFRCSTSNSCKFYFTYQLRSINRSVAPLMARWGLTAKSISKSDLLDGDQEVDSIFLYEVTLH
ncbi:hypothetical protein PHMEG_00011143 [Phytophthora megakarya]|uniref:Methyltransferase n=1 Tax=Phytophthora megakarya TaxID=4795 RepID=A0A225WDM5_9STRA|nr:hypothetical protein PHMEG_00011143 [Phytophthora megakarya]